MKRPPLLDLYDREMRRKLSLPDGSRTVLPHLVRIVLAPPRMSYISFSDLSDVDADAAIEAEIALFREHGGPFEWTLFDHDRPADLLDRLAAHDFDIGEVEWVMVLDLEQMPVSLGDAGLAGRVREIDAAELPAVRILLERVWNEDFAWVPLRLEAHLAIPGYLRVFVAEVEGVMASAAWIYLYPGTSFAGLYGGSTLQDHRGQGLYTALLAARASAAREAGYRYLTVDAGPMSRPIVARHGFSLLAQARACVWRPPSAK